MLFPTSPRVIYERNPLVEVICQIRFPRILRIDTELPAAFQEEIRTVFPNFSQLPAVELGKLTQSLPQLQLMGLEKAFGVGQQRFEFSTVDNAWKVTLTSQFLALVTSKYRRWEGFKEQLAAPLQALRAIYKPSFFSRVGLRYQDLIKRSQLGLTSVPWRELLQDQILGELATPEIESAASEASRSLLLRVGEQNDNVRIQHGFAKEGQDPENCYLFDCDFFSDIQTETSNATNVLDRLNKESGRLFRWCIKSRLHEAMGPRPAD